MYGYTRSPASGNDFIDTHHTLIFLLTELPSNLRFFSTVFLYKVLFQVHAQRAPTELYLKASVIHSGKRAGTLFETLQGLLITEVFCLAQGLESTLCAFEILGATHSGNNLPDSLLLFRFHFRLSAADRHCCRHISRFSLEFTAELVRRNIGKMPQESHIQSVSRDEDLRWITAALAMPVEKPAIPASNVCVIHFLPRFLPIIRQPRYN